MSDVKVSLIPQSSLKPSQELTCLWDKCYRTFDDPELLYHHLANDHVGRKSTGNLCLNCHWEKCETVTTKRDHITSHLRVHVPLKPHVCDTCNKAFKRPQDLKKHEKIHTEEHQAQISMLKNERMNRNAQAPTPPHYSRSDQSSPADSTASSPLPGPLSPPNAISNGSDHVVPTVYSSPYSQYSDSFSTPTNERYDLESYSLNNKRGYHQLSDITSNGVSNKRGAESLENFCWDVKKQRIAPVYNQEMSDRLNQLTFFLGDNDHFNLPAAICTKQDLQQFNNFLSDLSNQYGGELLDPNVFEDPTTGLFDFGLSPVTQYPNVATMALPTDGGFTVSDSLYPDLNLTAPVVAGTTEDLCDSIDFLSSVSTLQTPESIYPTSPSPPEEKIYSHDGTFCTGDDNLYINTRMPEYVGNQDILEARLVKSQLTTKPRDEENNSKTEVTKSKQINSRFGKNGPKLLKQPPLSPNPEKGNISIKHEESDGVDSLSNEMANMCIKDVPDSKKPDKQIAAYMDLDQKRKCVELISILFKKVNRMYRESNEHEGQSFVKVEGKYCYVSTEN